MAAECDYHELSLLELVVMVVMKMFGSYEWPSRGFIISSMAHTFDRENPACK